MALFRRSARLPSDVAARAGGGSIAWAEIDGGGWVVLTARDWVTVPAEAGDAVVRHGWHEVDNAQWESERSTVVVRWIDGATERFRLVGDDQRVPQVVRERVEASIVHQTTRYLPAGVQVRAAVRRDGDGELTSQVSVVGTAVVTPEIADVARQLEADVRGAVGLLG